MFRSKKILAIVLALVLACSLLPVSALAEEEAQPPADRTIVMVQTEDEARQKVELEDGTVYSIYSGIVNGAWSDEIKIMGYVESHFFSTLVMTDGPHYVTYNDDGIIVAAEKAYTLTDYAVSPGGANSVKLTPAETEYEFAEGGGVYYLGAGAEGAVGSIADIQFGWCDVFYAVFNDDGLLDGLYVVKDAHGTPAQDAATGEDLYKLQQRFEFHDGPSPERVQYFLYDPTGGSGADEKLPLLIWIHGFSIGMTPYTLFNQTNYPQLWASDARQAEFDGGAAYVMVPRSREDLGHLWGKDQVPYLLAAIKEVLAANPGIDTDRVYIGGFSMGGQMTWNTILAEPELFAAAFPACPAFKPTRAELYSVGRLPIWQFHGYYDETVNCPAYSLDVADFIQNVARPAGVDSRASIFKYITMPDGTYLFFNHCAWLPIQYNMTYMDGSKYGLFYEGEEQKGVMEGIGDVTGDTLTDWFKGKTLADRRDESGAVVSSLVQSAPFADVTENDWFKGTVDYAYTTGLVNGVSETAFNPGGSMTRGQFATIIWRMAGSPAPEGEAKFEDLTQDYYKNAIAWCQENGVVTGKSDTVFDPDSPIKRQEIVAILYRYAEGCLGMKPDSAAIGGDFADEDEIAEWAAPYIGWAVAAGLLKGSSDGEGNLLLKPTAVATRAEATALVVRFDDVATGVSWSL